jgi:hypothetical protein
MRRSRARFSRPEASNRISSLADFTTTTPELKFSVHTARRRPSVFARLVNVGNLARIFDRTKPIQFRQADRCCLPRETAGGALRKDHAQTKRLDHDPIRSDRIMIWAKRAVPGVPVAAFAETTSVKLQLRFNRS